MSFLIISLCFFLVSCFTRFHLHAVLFLSDWKISHHPNHSSSSSSSSFFVCVFVDEDHPSFAFSRWLVYLVYAINACDMFTSIFFSLCSLFFRSVETAAMCGQFKCIMIIIFKCVSNDLFSTTVSHVLFIRQTTSADVEFVVVVVLVSK